MTNLVSKIVTPDNEVLEVYWYFNEAGAVVKTGEVIEHDKNVVDQMTNTVFLRADSRYSQEICGVIQNYDENHFLEAIQEWEEVRDSMGSQSWYMEVDWLKEFNDKTAALYMWQSINLEMDEKLYRAAIYTGSLIVLGVLSADEYLLWKSTDEKTE